MPLEDEEGSPVQVSATDLAAALGDVNMVVLAGCHAAVGGENLPRLALDLVAAGIPAVVAMAGPVSHDFSPRLAEHLYRGLAASEEPEPLAVLSARRDIEAARLASTANGRDTGLVEWATPVLCLGGTSRPLFRLARSAVRTGPAARADAPGQPGPPSPASAPAARVQVPERKLTTVHVGCAYDAH